MNRRLIAAFGCGVLFAVGLALSGMTQPAKVLAFLDFFGRWDSTLAFVMVGASALFGAGWGLSGYCPGPVVTSLAAGGRPALAFAAGMIVGMVAYGALQPQEPGVATVTGARA